MTRSRIALAYTLAAAAMAALGAATAVAIVAVERAARNLGPDDDQTETTTIESGGSFTLTAFNEDGFQRLLDRIRCPDRCTCHGRYGEET